MNVSLCLLSIAGRFFSPLNEKTNKITAFSLCAAAFLTACGLSPAAKAQTAHFSGAQTTIPTSTLNYPYGVAVDSSGNIYLTNSGFGKVFKETPSEGGYTESSIGSGLYFPAGIAVDAAGNVYIADTGNNRVLKETLSRGTYAQTSISSGLSVPYGIAVDGSGNVYIADYGNRRVLKESASGGSYTEHDHNRV
jgi:streptogramin lyase